MVGAVSVDLTRLVELVEAFPRQKVAVVGDLVADEYVSGDIARVSREAPVLILRHREKQILPGGAANAVNNLAGLGARVLPFGVVGDDAAGRALLTCLRANGVNIRGILPLKDWTTTTKTRFLAGWTHTTRQQVLRVDREPPGEVPARARDAVASAARAALAAGAALLVSDYGCGLVSPLLVRKLGGKLITLDSRQALLDYADCGVTAATPNEPELEALYHRRIGNDNATLEQLGKRALRQMKLEALLVTRGKDGMALFEHGRPPQHIPVHGSEQAVDVTGAGDTVIAVFTLALAAGATHLEAARLANYAGGIVVMKRGTATVTREELLAAIRSDVTGAPPASK
jgi:rfaE bifunctional protein kinase chain/domain